MATYIPQEVFLEIIQAMERDFPVCAYIEGEHCVVYNPDIISSEDESFQDWFFTEDAEIAASLSMDNAPEGIVEIVHYETKEV